GGCNVPLGVGTGTMRRPSFHLYGLRSAALPHSWFAPRRLPSKHGANRLLLRRRVQVPVALALLLGAMPRPFVDEPLIDALAGAGRDEAVAQAVPAGHYLPLAPGQCPPEVVVGLVLRQRSGGRSLTPTHRRLPAPEGRRPRRLLAGPLMAGCLAPLLAAE